MRKPLRITQRCAHVSGVGDLCLNRYNLGMTRFFYRTASVRAHADQSISSARVCGVLTAESLRLIIADSTHWCGRADDLAHLVDYSGATLALSLGKMLDAARAAKPADAMAALPAAFVVSADQLPTFEGYVAAMMARGFLLTAFTEAAGARRWVAQQAQVRAHWRALHAGLRRSAP